MQRSYKCVLFADYFSSSRLVNQEDYKWRVLKGIFVYTIKVRERDKSRPNISTGPRRVYTLAFSTPIDKEHTSICDVICESGVSNYKMRSAERSTQIVSIRARSRLLQINICRRREELQFKFESRHSAQSCNIAGRRHFDSA